MIVRIRLRLGRSRTPRRTDRQTTLVFASLMTPVALMAWVLGGWRLAADLQWTGAFAIADGVFSHWQVWIALGIGVQFGAFLLHRYAAGDDDRDATVG